jgi:hypothetical protein
VLGIGEKTPRSQWEGLRHDQPKADARTQREEAAMNEFDLVDWRKAYERYRQSSDWLERRRLVLQRAGGICEGCRCRRASEIHHLEYPQGCLPGSPQWLAGEKLFQLVALCQECHADLHPAPNAERAKERREQ